MQAKRNYLIDMDGVLISGNTLIPGAERFLERIVEIDAEYLVFTNNPVYTPRDLSHKLRTAGLQIPEDRIFTSAMATARFIDAQKPNGKAFVIGESGLTTAVHEVGYVITDHQPDYVVLGETLSYDMGLITTAIRLVMAGARFVATNPDPTGPEEGGVVPACGAMAALIERASGRSPYYAGKPNPWMMRAALNHLGLHSEQSVMIGDRMDTDIVAGVESGLETILVLSGITHRQDIERYPYQPTYVVESIGDIEI